MDILEEVLEPAVIINTKEDLQRAYERYDVDNIDDLDNVLWFTYGVSLYVSQHMKDYINVLNVVKK